MVLKGVRVEGLQTMKVGLCRSFCFNDKEINGHCLEGVSEVKGFFFSSFNKEAGILYFCGVGTKPVQSWETEFPLVRKWGDLEKQGLWAGGENGMKCPGRGSAQLEYTRLLHSDQ